MRSSLVALVVLGMSSAVLAEQQPVVRVQVTPETVIVGEPAELTVTVLVPTWFTRPTVYPPFELANAMTRLPSDSSYSIRERVGSESWSGIVRTYEIYPLLGASYRMAGQAMTVTFANPGSDPISVDVEVPEVAFRGAVPDGAESLEPYLAGRRLELGIDVEGELDDLEPGDAVVLTYRAELDGLPAIFLPPLAPDLEFEGVSVYRAMPEVEDRESARRVETVTLVFDAGGEFSIPPMQFSFWNTESRSIEAATADGLIISVRGPPPAPLADSGSTENRWKQFGAVMIILVVPTMVLWRGIPTLVSRYAESAARRRQTEEYAFRKLVRALGSNNASEAYEALLLWMERLEPGMNSRTLAARYGDDSLAMALTALSAAVYHDAATAGNLRQIRGRMIAARQRYLSRGSTESALRLPPLNP